MDVFSPGLAARDVSQTHFFGFGQGRDAGVILVDLAKYFFGVWPRTLAPILVDLAMDVSVCFSWP